MKSSDNTLLFVGLFVLIVVIIALIVYYTRPGETKTPDQTSDDTVLKVENLTFKRTLNPDASVGAGDGDGVSGYTIEPYGIEYVGKADYKDLSRNVTFTMTWNNAPGFDDVVKGFEIDHWVRDTTANPAQTKYFNKKTFKYHKNQKGVAKSENREQLINFRDFGVNEMKLICSDVNQLPDLNTALSDTKCNYSVIGDNAFILYALTNKTAQTFNSSDKNTYTRVKLYDGVGANGGKDLTAPEELKISTNQLSVTLEMTTPETIEFVPTAPNETSSRTVISKSTYTVSNKNNSSKLAGVYLTTVPDTGGKQFYFTFEDGEFLMIPRGNEGFVKRKTEIGGIEKFIFEIVDREKTTGKIRQAATRFLSDNTARTVPEGPVTIPTSTAEKDRKYLSTKDDKSLKLYTQKDSDLTKNIFDRFIWTFNERIAGALTVGKIDGGWRSGGEKTGNSVCISGDYAFVGEPGFRDSRGRVHIYKRDKFGKWVRKQSMANTGASSYAGSLFGASVYAEGDTLAIGEPGFSDSRGQVYVYTRNSQGTFVFKTKLYASDASVLDKFGTSISIYGDFILVGAPGSGLITLFKKGATWGNTTSSTTKSSQGFGESLDIYENKFIVGAPTFNVNGQVFVYAFNTNTGEIAARPSGVDWPAVNAPVSVERPPAFFGTSVAIKDDTIFVGAPGFIGNTVVNANEFVANGGRVYVFKSGNTVASGGGTWSEWQNMPISNGKVNQGAPGDKGGYMSEQIGKNSEDGDEFGSSLDISGDKLIIGSSGSNKVHIYTGVVSTIQNSSVTTTRYLSSNHPDNNKAPVKVIQQPSEQSYAKFGEAVSIDGDYAIIGEPNRKDNDKQTGDSYIIPV